MTPLRPFRDKMPVLGQRVYVDPACTIIGDVELADDVSVWPGTVIRGDVNFVRIGARTNVQDGTIIHVSHHSPYNKAGYPTLIGEGVTVGHGCIIHACSIGDYSLIGMGACTDSKVNRLRFKDHDFAAIADFGMVRNAVDAAKALGVDARVGNIFSADLFYTPDPSMFDVMEKYGILGVEMEAAGIYGVAAEFGAKALTICTVSDHIRTHEQTTAAERQTTFNDMIKIALESVLLGDKE